MRDDAAHAFGQISRQRKFAAFVSWHLRVFRCRARHINFVFDDCLVLQNFAGEHEGVARHHGLDKIFLDLAEKAAAARNHFRNARAHQTNFEHIGFDDGADIEPVALRHPRVGDAPAAVLALTDAGEALVGFERIAAGGDEIDRGIEIRTRERGVRRRRCHLGVKLVAQERRAAGAAEHVLGQHVERADA